MSDRPRLLLIDDGEAYGNAIATHMHEYELVEVIPGQHRAIHGGEALTFLKSHHHDIDLVLLDMRFDVPEEDLLPLPEANTLRKKKRFQGVAILRALRASFPNLPIVVLTALEDLSLGEVSAELASLSLAYMLEDQGLDALRILIHQALVDSARAPEDGDVLWGRNRELRALRRRMAILARGRLPIVLEGETGTGKSFLARKHIHQNSARKGPFVTVDLSTMPKELISAHLFGATKGAYTGAIADRKGVFEIAHSGTLFIDEVQNIPLDAQKQLLLVLQENIVRPLGSNREVPIDVKVIVASNESLANAVQDGRFRSDLYMRLSPATRIKLPPLRHRIDDLPFLARRIVDFAGFAPDISPFRAQLCGALGLDQDTPLKLLLPGDPRPADRALYLTMPRAGWSAFLRHRWPGNLRELDMVLHNVAVFCIVGAVDAIEGGLKLTEHALQIDAGLVNDLLLGTRLSVKPETSGDALDTDCFMVRVTPQNSLNAVAVSIEKQYFTQLFQQTSGRLEAMADRLLGDPARARAVRLRMNQLGLKIRELRKQ